MAVWEVLARTVAMGAIATLLMDGWAVLLRRCGQKTLDYAMVGRWLGHGWNGRWRHTRIQDSPAVVHERAIGWLAHYALGVGFALLLVGVVGSAWLRAPGMVPALGFGLVSVLLPWLVLQPGMGVGVAASRAAQPWRARVQSVATHLVFGLGLFIGAWLPVAGG